MDPTLPTEPCRMRALNGADWSGVCPLINCVYRVSVECQSTVWRSENQFRGSVLVSHLVLRQGLSWFCHACTGGYLGHLLAPSCTL